jgi:hypothetical protein
MAIATIGMVLLAFALKDAPIFFEVLVWFVLFFAGVINDETTHGPDLLNWIGYALTVIVFVVILIPVAFWIRCGPKHHSGL